MIQPYRLFIQDWNVWVNSTYWVFKFPTDLSSLAPHVNHITVTAVQSTYALRVLRSHGLNGPNLWEVSAVAKLTYACSAWWGYADQIQNSIHNEKFKRLGFLPEDVSFSDICQNKITMFSLKFCLMKTICITSTPPTCAEYTVLSSSYRANDRELPVGNTAMRKNFITRMLYSKQ